MSAGDLSNIVLGLLAVMAGLEVLLFVCRGALLHDGQSRGLQREIAKLEEEQVEAQERNRDRDKELAAATARAGEAQAALRQANTLLAESQQARDVLVHRIGEPPGPRFRASLTKTLPVPADPNQVLIWSYPHFVDAWRPDAVAAMEVALHSFTDRAGYALGSFQPLDDSTLPASAPAAEES